MHLLVRLADYGRRQRVPSRRFWFLVSSVAYKMTAWELAGRGTKPWSSHQVRNIFQSCLYARRVDLAREERKVCSAFSKRDDKWGS